MIQPQSVAVIDEARCIGCTLCIEACPFDAILGAAKFMHTVIARDCIGCELCLPPCPVDCISMVATGAPPARAERLITARRARWRFELRKARLAREQHDARGATVPDVSTKQKTVARAIERARTRLAQRKP